VKSSRYRSIRPNLEDFSASVANFLRKHPYYRAKKGLCTKKSRNPVVTTIDNLLYVFTIIINGFSARPEG
jgi:hypothetical protein